MAIPAYVKDIEQLFAQWIVTPESTFEAWKAVWRKTEMSYIHGSNYQVICTEHEFMRLLFAATYSYLFMDTLKLQLGALYCLLLIWATQPLKPRYPIPISTYLWGRITELLAKEFPGVKDGQAAFKYLVDNKAFLFAATVELLPPPQAWPKHRSYLPADLRTADTLTGVVDLAALGAQENTYEKLKERAGIKGASFPLTKELTALISGASRHNEPERLRAEGEARVTEHNMRRAALERLREEERQRDAMEEDEEYDDIDDGIVIEPEELSEDEIVIPNEEEGPTGAPDEYFENLSDGSEGF